MTTPTNPQNDFSPFLPTTVNFPEEQERLKTFLVDLFAIYSDVINDKTIGAFTQSAEEFNGEKWIYDDPRRTRNGFSWVARVTQYPNTGVLILDSPNNINEQFRVTHVWGSASKPCTAVGAGDGEYFSYFSEGNSRISFVMTDLTITITTTADMTAYDGYIIIEYVRDGS
jgi:hypothetical protein